MQAFVEMFHCGEHGRVCAGPDARQFGDPWEWACFFELHGKEATFIGLRKPMPPKSAVRVACLALKMQGYAVRWERRRLGKIREVRVCLEAPGNSIARTNGGNSMSKIHNPNHPHHLPPIPAGYVIEPTDPFHLKSVDLHAKGHLKFTVLSETSLNEDEDLLLVKRSHKD